MKRILSGLATTAALLIGAGTALADGMPRTGGSLKDSPAPVQHACAQFGGFYIGGNLSSTYYRADRTDQDAYLTDTVGSVATYSATDDAFGGGIQGGYNFQKGCTVFGIEADWTWTGAEATSSLFPNKSNPSSSVTSSLNNFGTLRTRDGIVVDNLFLYVTGGLAWANIDTTYKIPGEQTAFSDTRFGWTAGFGTDMALSSNLVLTSQVLYLGFENKTHTINSVQLKGPYSVTHDDSAWVTRIGLNWRLN